MVPDADLAVDPEPTARLLRKTVDLRQSQSRSLADLLGRKEWLEHMIQDLGRHPAARVSNGKLDEVGWQTVVGRFLQVPGIDRDRAAAGHRVPGVGEQVQHRQLELAHIDLDRPQFGSEVHLDAGVPLQRAFEHVAHALEMGRKVDGLRVDGLAARERQQLVRQSSSPCHGTAHGCADALPLLLPSRSAPAAPSRSSTLPADC